jgi:molybdopterin synthase sulfur carrier subunit
MVKVTVWGSLRTFTDGKAEVEVEATNFKQVLDALRRDWPGLTPTLDQGVSLAIDGKMIRDSWFHPVRPDSEVVLMPYMQGG